VQLLDPAFELGPDVVVGPLGTHDDAVARRLALQETGPVLVQAVSDASSDKELVLAVSRLQDDRVHGDDMR
jgi:hypothetical protein